MVFVYFVDYKIKELNILESLFINKEYEIMSIKLFFRMISFFSVILFCFSCSTKNTQNFSHFKPKPNDDRYINHDDRLYNVPFINATETSRLDFGLSKKQVRDFLGEPLYVAKGEGETKTILWIYEVRTVLVKGEIVEENNNFSYYNGEFVHNLEEMSVVSFNDTTTQDVFESRYVPNKKNSDILHSDEVFHELALEFVDDGLINWYPYCHSGNCDDEVLYYNSDDEEEGNKETRYRRKYGSLKIEEY